MTRRRTLTAIGFSLACAGGVSACGSDTPVSSERLASASMLTLTTSAEPDTVALSDEVTLTLTATNSLSVGIRAPGPCPTVPIRMQIVGGDSVLGYTIVGAAGGCKLPSGPASVRLEPGWTETFVSRGRAGTILSPGLRAGTYRLRGVYEAPADTAVGPWFTIVVLP